MPGSKEKIPTNLQKKTFWFAVTGVSGTIIVALVLALVWIMALTLGYLQQVLLPIAIAGILAYLLEPIVSWLERRKINRTLCVSMVLVAFLSLLTLFFVSIVPPIINQTNDIINNRERILDRSTQFFEQTLKNPVIVKMVDHYYEESLKTSLQLEKKPGSPLANAISSFVIGEEKASSSAAPSDGSILPRQQSSGGKLRADAPPSPAVERGLDTKTKLVRALENNSAAYVQILMNWFSSGREVLSGGLAWIVGIVLVPIFVFVFLKDSASIAQRWTDILPLRASRFKEEVVETLTEINVYLIAFFRGQMIVSLIDGLLIGVSLWILGMPYAFIIGAAVGVLGIIPYIGIFSVFVPTLLLSWFVWHDWQHLVWVSVIFLACNQFDSWFIQPKIVGNAVGLHEVTVIFSVIFWSFIFGGVVGALLAVPLTASVKVIFQRYVWMNFQSRRTKPAESHLPLPEGSA